MLDLFPVPWVDLTLDALDTFLRDAEPEPLQWEAKGTEVRPEQVTKPAGAFANSFDGGYLILGATQTHDNSRGGRTQGAPEWVLEGVEFADEPALWVSNVVAAGLRPRPAIDIRTFERPGNRFVVVVWVPPVEVTPCVVRGTVYERLPGQSVPVKDPQRLADLYGRGQAALAKASALANLRAGTLIEEDLERTHDELAAADHSVPFLRPEALGLGVGRIRVSVGLCPLTVAKDPGSRLFTHAYATAMQKALRLRTAHGGYNISQPSLEQTQVSMSSANVAPGGTTWELEAWADGSVGVMVKEQDAHGSPAGVRRHLHAAWALADEFASALGGGAEHFVTFRVTGISQMTYADTIDSVPRIARGPLSLPDTPSPTFEHVYRELARIGGDFAWEPEPGTA